LTYYQAFISYAHADEAMAKRVQTALETYTIPRALKTKGQGKLSPIFRDVTELTAHHSLSEKITQAVQNSRYLIVLCSPAAKNSRWVNDEINLFRKLHGDSSILPALIEGTPSTSFPPALTQDGREPLAADMTRQKENFNFGISQMAASMLGVGLDELLQRHANRRRRRLQLITAGALSFAAVMGGMAWTAIDARDEAEVSRSEAEKMVEFMITDLKSELEPVGRLSILDNVGTRVTDYYDAIPLADMDDNRLARQARARHILGQVALDRGNLDKAKVEIEASYQSTQETLKRNPKDTNALFAHAQSAFWLGEIANITMNYEITQVFWEEYDDLSQQLYMRDTANIDWLMEAAWAQNNLGKILGKTGKNPEALEHFEMAISRFTKAIENAPDDIWIIIEKANAMAGKAKQQLKLGKTEDALKTNLDQIDILQEIHISEPNNYSLLEDLLLANFAHIDLFTQINNIT